MMVSGPQWPQTNHRGASLGGNQGLPKFSASLTLKTKWRKCLNRYFRAETCLFLCSSHGTSWRTWGTTCASALATVAWKGRFLSGVLVMIFLTQILKKRISRSAPSSPLNPPMFQKYRKGGGIQRPELYFGREDAAHQGEPKHGKIRASVSLPVRRS